MTKQIFKYYLTEKHCQGSDYLNHKDCAIAKLLKERGHTVKGIGSSHARFNNGYFSIKDNRGCCTFINPLIKKANEGEKFRRLITFVKEIEENNYE